MKTIALIYGGYSAEADISVKSGKNVLKSIDKTLYRVYEVLISRNSWSVQLDGNSYEIDKSDFSFILDGEKIIFDKVFIMIHGNPGENGLLQAYFEMLDIPVAGCSSLTATLAFDKYACKTHLRDTGVMMAKDIFMRKGDSYDADAIVAKLGLPVFVKPNADGSSFGITKVKEKKDLDRAIEVAFESGDTLIIEESISGRELTDGVYYNGKEVVALPVTEIIPKNEYFDYEAKYLGASSEVCPAEISKELSAKIQQVTKKIYCHFGCRGVVRMDYIVRGEEIFFLEINPIPGMTDASLVPQMVRAAGINMTDFITSIIDN